MDKIERSEAEWRERLNPDVFRITRAKGTERPFSGTLLHNTGTGMYECACCGQPLFASDTKFDSGSGWPSYWAPAADDKVTTKIDRTLGIRRVEVACSRCDAHLGHVFEDGPDPTGLRYCINSLALRFESDEE